MADGGLTSNFGLITGLATFKNTRVPQHHKCEEQKSFDYQKQDIPTNPRNVPISIAVTVFTVKISVF